MDFELENDGIDHINIYSKGKTKLGRWLSNFSFSPINIPNHGNFKSIEGYWYWLRTKDNRLRNLFGYEAKKIGKLLIKEEAVDGNFIFNIKKAIDIKIKSNEQMMNELLESTLPFTHYYVFNNTKVNAGFEWIVEHIENRRYLLKEWKSKQINKI